MRPAGDVELNFAPSAIRQVWVLGTFLTVFGVLALVAQPPTFIAVCAWIAVALGVVGAPMLLVRYRRLGRGPVLTINERGIRDARVSKRLVLWSQVQSIRVWELGREQYVILCVDDQALKEVGANGTGRVARRWSRTVGADGIRITPAGLPISFAELVAAIEAHAGSAAH